MKTTKIGYGDSSGGSQPPRAMSISGLETCMIFGATALDYWELRYVTRKYFVVR